MQRFRVENRTFRAPLESDYLSPSPPITWVQLKNRALIIIAAGFLTAFIAYSVRYAYGMLLPEMLPDLGITKTEAGAILTTYFLVYTICTPFLGALSDRYSYRMLVTVFVAILGTGALMMSTANSFNEAAFFFAIAGIGHAACWAPVVVLVQKWVPDNKRGAALSFVTMGAGTGILIWGWIVPVIVSAAGWRAGWLAIGICGIGIALADAFMLKDPHQRSAENSASRQGLISFITSYREVLQSKIFWFIGLAYSLVGTTVIILFAFLPIYARETLHMSYANSTRLVTMIALFGFIGMYFLGSLSDKIGRLKIMLLCSIVMGLATLGLTFTNSFWSLYALTALYGIGYGAVWPVYAAAASDYFPSNMAGGIVGLWTLIYGIGSIIGPILAGWLIDMTGQFREVFFMSCVICIVSLLLLIRVPPARKTAPSLQVAD